MAANTSKLLVPLATLVVAGAVAVGSGATWTTSTTSTSSVTSGTLLQSNGANGTTLNLANLKPGDVMSGSLTITNTGTLNAKIAMAESGVANPFVVTSGVSDLQIVIKRDATTVYSGNFGGLGASTDVTGTDPLLAVDDPTTTTDNEKTTTFTFTVTLKSTADPLSQGRTAGATYGFVTSPVDGQTGLSGVWN